MKLYPSPAILFIIWFAAIFTVGFFGFINLPHSSNFGYNFLESLSNWDGRHFLTIAKNGYTEFFQYAFFPLYPLLIKASNFFIQDLLFVAILISLSGTLAGVIILKKLVKLYFKEEIANSTVWFLLCFPTAFFFLVAYSEGLFFFLTVLSFYAFKKSNFALSSAAAILASMTRLAGLAIVVAILFEVFSKGVNRRNWIIFLSPIGIVGYCIILYYQAGDPLAFVTAERNWQRTLSIPGLSFIESIKKLSDPTFFILNMSAFFDFVAAIFGLGMMLRSFRFLPKVFSVYGLISVLLPIMTSNLMSTSRFLLPIFPIFILISLNKNQYLTFGYQIISLMLLSVFTVLFLNGYWVA